MVLGAIVRTVGRVSTKVVQKTPVKRTVNTNTKFKSTNVNLGKQQPLRGKVVGTYKNKKIITVNRPKIIADPTTKTQVRSMATSFPTTEQKIKRGFVSGFRVSGASPIDQDTGLGITFKTNRPVQRIEGTGKKLFGDFGIPIRPDNAILIRPKDPSQGRKLLGQFRKIQNTNQVRQYVQGSVIPAIKISDVRNLKFGGERLKDIATVRGANNQVLQKGDIIFRRVGQEPKDQYTFGAIGDTFLIDKNIANPTPFTASSTPRPELLKRFSNTGINKDDPLGELLKIKEEQVATKAKLAELVSSDQFKDLVKSNPKVRNLIGQGSELGVQDTASRGSKIVLPFGDVPTVNPKTVLPFGDVPTVNPKIVLPFGDVPNIAKQTKSIDYRFTSTELKNAGIRNTGKNAKGELRFTGFHKVKGENRYISNVQIRKMMETKGVKQTKKELGISDTTFNTAIDNSRKPFYIEQASELGIQDIRASGGNPLKAKSNISLGQGSGDVVIRETPDIGFQPLGTVFDSDLTGIGRNRLLRRMGFDRPTAKVFADDNFKGVLNDVDNPRGFIIESADEINQITPPKVSSISKAKTDPAVSLDLEGNLLRNKPTASQTKSITKELNNPVFAEEQFSILGELGAKGTSPTGRQPVNIFTEKIAFMRGENTFARGFDETDFLNRADKVRKNRDDLNFGDFI